MSGGTSMRPIASKVRARMVMSSPFPNPHGKIAGACGELNAPWRAMGTCYNIVTFVWNVIENK